MTKLTETTNDKLRGNGGEVPPIPELGTFIRTDLSDPQPPMIAKAEQPLKIACVGTAPSSRMLAPYNDPTWTIWGCSPGNINLLPRVDAWFEIHGTALTWEKNKSYGPGYIEWLKAQKFPIYMQDQSLVPRATPYPIHDMLREFGPYNFTSSFAYMMALGIYKGAKEIALYGIDMASKNEYILQRPGGQNMIVEGARRGCKVWAPYESDIMMPPPLYGYSDTGPFGRKMNARIDEIEARLADMRNQKARLDHDVTYLEGAREDMDYLQSIWGGAQEVSVEGQNYLERLLQKANGNGQDRS